MWRSAALCLSVLSLSSLIWAGPVERLEVSSYDPIEHWEFDLESGALWSVGNDASPLDYVILPQILSFKSPKVLHAPLLGGEIVVRNRFSLLLEPIVEGPESYFIGLQASAMIEWWNASRSFALFLSSGGGIGLMDSKGYEVEGAQGQDLNFNWFVYSGARFRMTERGSLSLGVMYQHISNTGLDDINPGINAMGPMIGYGWHF
jgi:lipid A 3-O-deacylase